MLSYTIRRDRAMERAASRCIVVDAAGGVDKYIYVINSSALRRPSYENIILRIVIISVQHNMLVGLAS